MTSSCPHSTTSPLQGAVDVGLLLCEQPEVHAEAETLRTRVGLIQSLLDAGDQAVLTLFNAGECVPANSLAGKWWLQASPQEQAELHQWALSAPGALAESTRVWTYVSRKVLAVKRVQVAPAIVALYLRDITQATISTV